jgi:NAD+ kinase
MSGPPSTEALGLRRLLVSGDDPRAVAGDVSAAGFLLVTSAPEVVLCYGGDGTLLRAERDWPGVPKVPARVGSRARLCPDHELPAILARLRDGLLERETLSKLELAVAGWQFLAMNDIVMRNESPATAVRFALHAEGVHADEVTGDGLVFATPFGSTGYYRSITRSVVERGLGIAFNNSTEPYEPLLVTGEFTVEVAVLRGPAVLVHDNDVRAIPLREGHRFSVRGSSAQAVVLGLDALRCQQCRKADGSRFNPH